MLQKCLWKTHFLLLEASLNILKSLCKLAVTRQRYNVLCHFLFKVWGCYWTINCTFMICKDFQKLWAGETAQGKRCLLHAWQPEIDSQDTHDGRELTSVGSSLTFACLPATCLPMYTHIVINIFLKAIWLLGVVVHAINSSTRGGGGCRMPVRCFCEI